MEYIIGLWTYVVNNAPMLVGFALPPIVDILNRDVPEEIERFWVSVLVCIFAAALLHWNEISSNPEQLAVWFGVIFTESQATYNLYFKHSYIRQTLQNKIKSGEVG